MNAGQNLIDGSWTPIPGDALQSHDPSRPAEPVWAGSPRVEDADAAVEAARRAFPAWRDAGMAKRTAVLRTLQGIMRARADELGALIMRETGKAQWDSLAEAKLLADKIDITLDEGEHGGRRRVTDFRFPLSPTREGGTRFRPHGVMGVIGPFNFPAHLANGHMVPALLAGNTVVIKPSDKTPACGALLARMYHDALETEGAPRGVVNLVQGGADVASRLVASAHVNGILFTGSWSVGRRILEANLDRPGRVVALEMGGNNAAVVMDDADLRQAVIECVRSAYVTTGQRCTCTRRIIVHRAVASRFVDLFRKATASLVVGDPRGVGGKPAFMGPLIRAEAVTGAVEFQRTLLGAGGRALIELTTPKDEHAGHFVTPGLIEVPGFSISEQPARDAGADVEAFAPLARLCVVDSLEQAIDQANASRYGLAASIFTRSQPAIERFLVEAKAGCVNVNTGTAGASSKLPFGGLDRSGNHRPAGSFALDYCAYPVATMVESGGGATLPAGMSWDDGWVG